MTKIQSGLVFIVAGVLLNLVGRFLITLTRDSHNVVVAGGMALWMVASLVLALFGLFRLIVGLVSRNKPPQTP